MPTSSRDRALSIVELLARNVRGLPLSTIADRLDIPKAATHRLLNDLRGMGYAVQDTDTLHYRLTVKLASLGLGFLAASGITDATQPLLDTLAQRTGELARLALFEADQLIWVAKAQGARTGLRYDPDTGAEVYLPAAANGLALLAALPDEQVLSLVAKQGMDRCASMGPGAPRSIKDLLQRVDATRERGFAVVYDSYEAGTSAIASAIRHPVTGAPLGSVSIAGPSLRICEQRLPELVPAVLECAGHMADISRSSPTFASR